MKLTPFQTFCRYVAIKNHFNSKYDFFRYNGKTRLVESNFEVRPDKYFFAKLSRRYDEIDMNDFLASNFFLKDYYIYDLIGDDCKRNHVEFKKRLQSLTYTFENQLRENLTDPVQKLFQIENGSNSLLLSRYYSNKIHPETMIILNDLLKIFDTYDSQIDDEFLWPKERDKLKKLTGFIRYDKKSCTEILKKHFQDHI